jgi:hypothetical protein
MIARNKTVIASGRFFVSNILASVRAFHARVTYVTRGCRMALP